jgi:4-hydroxyphenylacetate 3-monooxygenase
VLRSGNAYLESLRDGRVVFIGSEKVTDVTQHPAFASVSRTFANMYDFKRASENIDVYSYEENGERFSTWYLQARTKDDLRKRMRAHKGIADLTLGLMGRSPDHVASSITGMSINPKALDTEALKLGANLLKYYEYCKKNDIFATYAVLPPQAARSPEFYAQKKIPMPSLEVTGEYDGGLIISGMKMLATSAVFCDEIWIGNLLPLAPDQGRQSITCSIPVNTPGLSLWSRQPFAPTARSEFDSPLSWRFDESDSMVMCKNVRVPWERVFVHNDAVNARSIYITTPAHGYANHQSNVRFWSKMQFLIGLASKVAQATGAIDVPQVREELGRLASLEALIGGLVHGQIEDAETWNDNFVAVNRRIMYSGLNWCTEGHSAIIDKLRELSGGGVFQMPANSSVVKDPDTLALFQTYWQTPQLQALDRMKLMKLVWEVVGSEFAGRQQQYEKFYAGASFVVRNHSFRECNWKRYDAIVDRLMSQYDA